jgi:hypothetical protein
LLFISKNNNPISFLLTIAIMTSLLLSLSALPKQSAASAQKNAVSTMSPNTQAGPSKTTAAAKFLTYENPTSGIKIQYPPDWTKESAGQGVTFVLSNGKNNSNPEGFLAKLNATTIAGFPPNVPVKAMADGVLNGYRHFLSNFHLDSYTNITVGGNPAIKIVYTYTDSKNASFKATDIATIKNNRLYVIQYYVQSPKYQSYFPILQKMADSLQITK